MKTRKVDLVAWLALAAACGILFSAVAIIALHASSPEFDPMTRAMSDYVHGRYGWLLAASGIMLGVSLFALSCSFRQLGVSTPQQIGVLALAGAGACLITVGLFPIDNTPDGSFNTLTGAVHAVAGHLLSPFVIAAMFLLSGPLSRLRGHKISSWVALTLAALALLTFAALLYINTVAHLPYGGMAQRIFMGLVWSWLLLTSVRLVFSARPLDV